MKIVDEVCSGIVDCEYMCLLKTLIKNDQYVVTAGERKLGNHYIAKYSTDVYITLDFGL